MERRYVLYSTDADFAFCRLALGEPVQAVAAFHPEMMHTPDGAKLLREFALRIAGFTGGLASAR